MADNAFIWAAQRGLKRKNEVHGEEEADIPLDMRWAKTNETGSRVEFQGEAEVDETRL